MMVTELRTCSVGGLDPDRLIARRSSSSATYKNYVRASVSAHCLMSYSILTPVPLTSFLEFTLLTHSLRFANRRAHDHAESELCLTQCAKVHLRGNGGGRLGRNAGTLPTGCRGLPI